jgi:uncharacterized protein
VDHPLEVYRFLRDEVGAQFIQFIPVVHYWGQGQEGDYAVESVDPLAYGAFLSAVFDEWVRRDVGKVFVQTFDATLAGYVGVPPGVCVFAPTCGTALVLEHNGDLYQCDHFVTPANRLGNILETPIAELVALPAQREFALAKATRLPPQCRSCEFLPLCNGGCPRNRLRSASPGDFPLNHLCEGYKLYFNHTRDVMTKMRDLLAVGRSPAEVMGSQSPSGRGGPKSTRRRRR